MFEDRTVPRENHNQTNCFPTQILIIPDIAPLECYYILANLEISEEINLILDHLELILRITAFLHSIGLHCVLVQLYIAFGA
jgi:hypothetical protein